MTAVEVMIIIAILGLLAAIIFGKSNQAKVISNAKTISSDMVEVIDKCQYIKNFTTHGYYVYTHKGNCNNPIHIYNTNTVEKYWR